MHTLGASNILNLAVKLYTAQVLPGRQVISREGEVNIREASRIFLRSFPLKITNRFFILIVQSTLMKRLLAISCFAMYLHNIGQAPLEAALTLSRSNGEKVLVKALTAFVKRGSNKKLPARKIDLPSFEGPWV
jgi:hypothetical protein